MRFNSFYPALVLAMVAFSSAVAQDKKDQVHDVKIDLPEVALLDVESKSNLSIVIAAQAPEEAGLPLDLSKSTNSDLWINYTSIVGSKKEPSRQVTAQITSGAVPDGLRLFVEAANAKGKGNGKFGKPSGKVHLSSNPKNIITNVGSSYTGDGPDNGHQLTYILEMFNLNKFGDLDFDQAQEALSITYTLSDN